MTSGLAGGDSKEYLPCARLRRCHSPLPIMDNSPRSPLCRCSYKEVLTQGNLIAGCVDENVQCILLPAILDVEDPRGRVELMVRLCAVNKAWRSVVNTSEEWYEHVGFKEGYKMRLVSADMEDNYVPGGTPERTLCLVHPLITLDMLLPDPRYM
jgi:hypothetical protein